MSYKMLGFIIGQRLRPLLEATEELTYYLYGTITPSVYRYNGAVLPKLPEWDKEAYPYARIRLVSGMYYFEVLSKEPVTTQQAITKKDINGLPEAGEWGTWVFYGFGNSNNENGADAFGYPSFVNNSSSKAVITSIVWANYDIFAYDGTLYLAASEPVCSQEGGNVAIADGEGYVLYDGAVLPKLPEWDKEAYPYAYISLSHWNDSGGVLGGVTDAFRLNVFSSYVYTTTSDGTHCIHHETENTLTWKIPVDENDTPTTNVWKTTSGIGVYETFTNKNWSKWANFDFMAEDGKTVLFASSVPIPLVSSEPIRYENDIPVYKQKE